MYKRVFLDANIIADIFDSSRVFHKSSVKAVEILAQNIDVELFTSCDIVTTIYYILSKKGRDNALEYILNINELCNIVEFGNQEILNSCLLMKSDKRFKDLEDTIQYIMAKKVDADLILSNDKEFVSTSIKLLSSSEFLEIKDSNEKSDISRHI